MVKPVVEITPPPRTSTVIPLTALNREQTRFCVDCKRFLYLRSGPDMCADPGHLSVDVIRKEIVPHKSCTDMREASGPCGPEAKLFVASERRRDSRRCFSDLSLSAHQD